MIILLKKIAVGETAIEKKIILSPFSYAGITQIRF
jgi:hypothetical protein